MRSNRGVGGPQEVRSRPGTGAGGMGSGRDSYPEGNEQVQSSLQLRATGSQPRDGYTNPCYDERYYGSAIQR